MKHSYWSYLTAEVLSRSLPRGMAYWLGLRIADADYRFNAHDRLAVRGNLQRILTARGIRPSENTLRGLTRKTFQYFGKYLVDFFRFSRLSERDIATFVSVEHPEYLTQCQERGRGVLAITAHFGNWELAGAAVSAMGNRLNAVVMPERLERLNRLLEKYRRRRGLNLIPLGFAPAQIVKCLRKQEMVALLADRDFSPHAHRIPFFGADARLPRGPAALSVRTGAPVLPGFTLRLVDDSFLFRFYPPIYPERGMTEADVQSRITAVLEDIIGEYPYQWFIFEDFWGPET